MPALKLSQINLLPKDAFEASSLGRFLRWSLVTGRMIVVLTEFVIILAFGSRFWFDRRLNDLLEEIDQKQAVVESYAAIEGQMRDVLAREERVAYYLNNQRKWQNLFATLVASTPRDVVYDSLEVDENAVRIEGSTGSELSFIGLVNGLRQIEGVERIRLGETKFDRQRGGLNFDLAAEFGQSEKGGGDGGR